jgi:hypothetical protein
MSYGFFMVLKYVYYEIYYKYVDLYNILEYILDLGILNLRDNNGINTVENVSWA